MCLCKSFFFFCIHVYALRLYFTFCQGPERHLTVVQSFLVVVDALFIFALIVFLIQKGYVASGKCLIVKTRPFEVFIFYFL